MLKHGKDGYFDAVRNLGDTDYLQDGEIVKDAPMSLILVGSSSDLSSLENYEPGSIAYTAGFAQMWQLSPAGEWVAFS